MLRLKWLVAGVLFAFAAVGALWVWNKVKPNGALVGKGLSEILEEKLRARPTVYLKNYVVVEEKRPIAELALISRRTDVEHRMESVLFRSKAQLGLRATYNVKAGFDLRKARYAVTLDPGLAKARLDIPAPRILSMEMTEYHVLADKSGWWNRISERDRELAMRNMQAQAKLEALRAGILKDCREALEKELADVSVRTGVELEFNYIREGDSLAKADSLKASSNSPMLP